jgi:hypothetical protein
MNRYRVSFWLGCASLIAIGVLMGLTCAGYLHPLVFLFSLAAIPVAVVLVAAGLMPPPGPWDKPKSPWVVMGMGGRN